MTHVYIVHSTKPGEPARAFFDKMQAIKAALDLVRPYNANDIRCRNTGGTKQDGAVYEYDDADGRTIFVAVEKVEVER